MTTYFTYTGSVLMLVMCGFIACKKDHDIPLSTGSISGTISPKAAAAGIQATNLHSNKVYAAKIDTTTGLFKMAGIDTGSYKISFTSYANFLNHPDVTISVAAGKNNDIGTIVFESAGITGNTSPKGSVSYVSVNTSDGTPYGVSLDTATGIFKTAVLPAGDYYVSFVAVSGYISPSSTPVKVTLATGQSFDMGTIVMLPHKLSGVPFIASSFGATYSSPNFTITTATNNIDNGSHKDFRIIMDNITAPGTYECKNTATSAITYSTRNSSLSPTITWSTMTTGGSGTVVITSIDTVKKEITGTFKAILVNPANPNVVINDGSFDFVYQ